MSGERKQVCACCQQAMIEHRQTLSSGLVRSLWTAYKLRGQNLFRVSELELTHTEQANWQKLRYWGLAEKVASCPGKWAVTQDGMEFLLGGMRVCHALWTYRGEVVDRDRSKLVGPGDCWDDYRSRVEWMQDARDRDPGQQVTLPGLTPVKK